MEAADEATAAALAASCGREVEVLEERTEFQTLHALPDGQMRLDTSIAAVRTQVSGEWADIDTTLVESAAGIEVAAPAVEMVFSDGSPGQPLASMQRDGHQLTFDVPFDLPAPVVYGTGLEYPDVIDGVDLLVSVNADATGFSEVLRVESPQAAADPRIADLAFPITVSDGLELTEADGGFAAVDSEGERVFRSPQPAMWDSRADRAAPNLTPRLIGGMSPSAGMRLTSDEGLRIGAARLAAPVDGDAWAFMDVALEDQAVQVGLDEEMLADPSTVWPVYVDPSVSGSRSEWVAVSSAGWKHYNFSSDDGVGRCGTTGSPMYCSSVFTERLAWQFTGLQAIGNVDPSNVTSATFSVYGTHSYSCTASPIEAWWTGGINSGTTWSFGWTGSNEFGGGMHLRLGIGRDPANLNRARWHVDFGSTHVPNGRSGQLISYTQARRGAN
ncbi:hypothetical protein [Actinotalea fermentans]|uniref:Uncharacterized protein n=1 Tax=Actinotalea fermentans TaxID=43671 RepID=A0A511YTI4_9CELL|nr:hypothetical protein [Actinotalea fermentans]KGM15317.1 hypothetical protein N867_09845 [Actinotalea fermentans ATCC 43279 = JCM 9966 = DSM 3133]GEN78511.1 hypothetical protein AFE02nite_02450 [Actinotalea fermentans]